MENLKNLIINNKKLIIGIEADNGIGFSFGEFNISMRYDAVLNEDNGYNLFRVDNQYTDLIAKLDSLEKAVYYAYFDNTFEKVVNLKTDVTFDNSFLNPAFMEEGKVYIFQNDKKYNVGLFLNGEFHLIDINFSLESAINKWIGSVKQIIKFNKLFDELVQTNAINEDLRSALLPSFLLEFYHENSKKNIEKGPEL